MGKSRKTDEVSMEAPGPETSPAVETPKEKDVYVFPSRVQCPKCGCLQRSGRDKVNTKDGVQYRQCNFKTSSNRTCGEHFKIIGNKI